MRLALAAALSVVCVAAPAAADWQYTKWGSTPEQVIAASGGSARAVQGTPAQQVWGSDLRAEGTYTAGGFDFTSRFFFDPANRLSVVKLPLIDTSRCEQLRETVSGLYGQPIEGNANSDSMLWSDVKANNLVRFSSFGAAGKAKAECFVIYRPILSGGGNGL
jgi:opacity protein-like surface antigen